MSDGSETLGGMQELLSHFLQVRGFHAGHESVSAAFGDAVVIFESPGFRLRLVSDRGAVHVDVGVPDVNEWFDVNVIRVLLTGADTLSIMSAKDIGRFLERYYEDIAGSFGPCEVTATIKKLFAIEDSRARRMFPGASAADR